MIGPLSAPSSPLRAFGAMLQCSLAPLPEEQEMVEVSSDDESGDEQTATDGRADDQADTPPKMRFWN